MKFVSQIKEIKVIHVADREGDIYEVLSDIKANKESCVIRCSYDRNCIDENGKRVKIKSHIHSKTPLGMIQILVPDKGNSPERVATLTLRSCHVKLAPEGKEPIEVNVVEACEKNPPENESEPLNWLLWTFEDVDTLDDVIRVVGIYKKRWTVEQYHKISKSVMKVEKSQLKTDDRIDIYLAMCLAVALRILQIKLLSQRYPDEPCTIVYTESEWKATYQYEHGDLPEKNKIPTVLEMTKMVAILGGYHNRKSDGPPGVITLGRGLGKLAYLSKGYQMGISDLLKSHRST